MASNQPNATLYVNNLNDKVNTKELRSQLFALFTTYGKIIDIVTSKGLARRGQAFLVFTDLAGATSAMRACEGMVFYDKPLHIDYAKTKSFATLRREDPSFVSPSAANASTIATQSGRAAVEKRQRDDDSGGDSGRQVKREKIDDDDDEEMEIDEEEETPQQDATIGLSATVVPPTIQYPSARLLCTNLPQEVTDNVLSVLFQQYQGFQTTHVVPSPTPHVTGAKVKMAQVLFDSPDLARVAKDALDGFTLKKGWLMSVAFI